MTQTICPKCKKTVSEKDTRCPHCNMKLKAICPTCGSANSFGVEKCSECDTVLIKYCENCGSANYPEAENCRKCGLPFAKKEFKFEKKRTKKEEKQQNTSPFFKTKQENTQIDINSQTNQDNKPLEDKKVSEEEKIELNTNIEEQDKPEETVDLDTVNIEQEQEQEQPQQELNNKDEDEYEDKDDNYSPIEEIAKDEEIVNTEDLQTIEYEDIEQNTDDLEEDLDENSEEEFSQEEEIEAKANSEDFISEEEETEKQEDIEESDNEIEEANDNSEIEDTQQEEKITIEELIEKSENPTNKNINLPEEQEIVFFDDAQILIEQLSNIIRTQNNAVISAIAAEEGMGKTTILNTFINSLTELNIIPIVAECSESIKLAPFGCIRDFLLKLLTLPDMHPDIETFYGEETKQLFVQNFPALNNQEIINFMNFLYPTLHGQFESILDNKNTTYILLEKVLKSIISTNRAIFVIDNFDYIDTASFEFIQHLINRNIINNNTKLFITYREKKTARCYFDENISRQDIFTTMYLNKLPQESVTELIKNFANTQQVPTAVNYAIYEKGNGNIFFTEQFLALLFDVGYMYIDKEQMVFKEEDPIPFLPKNTDEIIQLRLKAINSQEVRDSLLTAAIIGYKFDKTVFAAITDITDEQANQLLQQLVDLMYIQPCSEFEYTFKNISTWAVIFEEAHKDPRFAVICKKVYYIFGKYGLSNPILKASVAKYRDEAGSAINAWIEVANLCSYIGDTYIYALALEQYLIHTGYNEETTEISEEQQTAMEQIAKLVYKQNPQKAIKYLTIPIALHQEDGDNAKVIELGSYIIKACTEISDYNGVIETVDLILNTVKDEITPLEKAILTSRKLNVLFKEGNCEEGINLANNDILPILEEELSKDNDVDFSQLIFSTWFDTSVNLVNLYALQGNSKALEIIENTEEILHMNNIENVKYNIKLSIAKAFTLTVIGRIQDSVNILKNLEGIEEYNTPEYINDRNIIYALNLVLSDVTTNLREILYEYAQYAENTNNKSGKHIYKLMLAWLMHKEGEYSQANIIFNEELTYFAKEKTVTGALIGWLFIAKNTLETAGIENAEHVAMKALEVAQNPKFSQYHITIYLQKLIAEINLLKGDLNSAKMYLEKGMLIAKQFGLDLARIELYRSYTKYLQIAQKDMAKEEQSGIKEKIQQIFEAIITDAERIKVPGLQENIKQDYNKIMQEL